MLSTNELPELTEFNILIEFGFWLDSLYLIVILAHFLLMKLSINSTVVMCKMLI